jgi:hypothetical protein
MQFDLEKTTSFAVSADEVIKLIQDQGRFMVASGGTEEDSIKFDEQAKVWHGESINRMRRSLLTTEIRQGHQRIVYHSCPSQNIPHRFRIPPKEV